MTLYRKPAPYRKPQSYRGSELVPGVVEPTFSSTTRHPYRDAAPQADTLRSPLQILAPHGDTLRTPWDASIEESATTRLPLSALPAHAESPRLRWDWTNGVDPAQSDVTLLPWSRPAPQEAVARLPWSETSERESAITRLRHRRATPRNESRRLRYDAITPHAATLQAFWHRIVSRGALIALPWGRGTPHHGDTIAPWPIDPNPGEPGSDPITVPILPVYMMIPTLTAVRLPERTPVTLINATVSTDASLWGWTFSGQMPAVDMPLVNPAEFDEPVSIEVSINGYLFVVLVETCDDERRFSARTASIRGRSRSAMLAAPNAPLRSRLQAADRNASQLADEELFGTGWTMVWDALDWLVPGGLWSYSDIAPIDALMRLAGAVGARIETDRTLLQLAAKPTYDVSPWEWDEATPFAILPASIVTNYGGSWQGGPNANGVYVYSESAGFGSIVKITGTGGEVRIPMIVDRLAVDADPARERGRQALAAAGKIKTERVVIPLFPSPADPGLIPVGALLEIAEGAGTWRGQCMGVSITAQRSGSALSVRQTLQIERHFR